MLGWVPEPGYIFRVFDGCFDESVGGLATDHPGVLEYIIPLILPFALDIAVPRLAASADDPDTPGNR